MLHWQRLMTKLQKSRSQLRRDRYRQPDSYRTIALETVVKILTNGILSAAAIAALVKLLPYHQTQRAKLHEIRAEVEQTEERVKQLRANFNRNFDSSQTRTTMKEYSPWVDPNQHRIFLLEESDASN